MSHGMNRRIALRAIWALAAVGLASCVVAPDPGPGYEPQAVVPIAPPPPRVEVIPPPPRPIEVVHWQPGYWRWNGYQHVWVPGQYVARPRPRAVWVPGHWVQRPNGWAWIPGHWR